MGTGIFGSLFGWNLSCDFCSRKFAPLLGIAILADMPIKFFGFNLLAACVAAAVSASKKAVSATAVSVVGIGAVHGADRVCAIAILWNRYAYCHPGGFG